MTKTIDNIQGILFDMDGTLVNSIQAVENAWRAWGDRHSLDLAMVVKTAHGRPARDTIAQLTPHLDQATEANWVLQKELKEPGVVAIAGINEFLSSLGNFPWGIVTSANRSLALYRLKLARLPIPQVLITVENIKKGKPDPEGYLLGAQLLGLAPGRCLVVEDTPAGLAAGRSAGMRLMGICTTFSSSELNAELLIQDYLALKFNSSTGSLIISH